MDQKTHCFLTHNWGRRQPDGTYDNHERVRKICNALQVKGLLCWFDSERMTGTVIEQMANGIRLASVVVVFITQEYINKVDGTRPDDNCKLEFIHASNTKTKAKMVAVVLDRECLDSKKWVGPVGIVLGGELYIDFTDESDFDMKINNIVIEIGKRIEDVNLNDIIVTNTTHLLDNLKSPDDIGKAIFDAASKGRTDELKRLCELNKGNAVLNWKNEDDHTPLSAACGYGMHESVSILLLSGCDKNSVDKFGNCKFSIIYHYHHCYHHHHHYYYYFI